MNREGFKLGIGFFGGCGCNTAKLVMQTLDPKSNPHLRLLVANTDAAQLNNHFESSKDKAISRWRSDDRLTVLSLGGEKTNGKGAGGDPAKGREATEESMGEIEKFMDGLDTLIIVGGLGKGTGTGAMPCVAKKAKEKDKPTLAIVTMPRLSEGRSKKASQALRELYLAVPTLPVYNEEASGNLTVLDAWEEVNNNSLLPQLQVLREVIQEVGDGINCDLNDFRNVIYSGSRVAVGIWKATEGEKVDPDGIVESLIQRKLQNFKDTIRGAKAMMFWFHGQWLMEDADGVILAVRKRTETDSKGDEFKIESFIGYHQNVTDNGKWMGLVVVSDAPDIPRLEVGSVETVKQVPQRHENASKEPVNESTASLQCRVDGEITNINVNSRVRQEWLYQTGLPLKQRDRKILSELQEKILKQTGLKPDLPEFFVAEPKVDVKKDVAPKRKLFGLR